MSVGAVVIGRNEGERLKACLRSLAGVPTVYVDSGSTDGSQDFAGSVGVEVVALQVPPAFTAARARNEGLARLREIMPEIGFVQFVDGDCEVEAGWIAAGLKALRGDQELGGVFGRRRERFPESSLYNRMCDQEWDVPIGPTPATGGDALFRAEALAQVGGYNPELIAGEEPDMCLRMGRHGWRFRRIDAAMTVHDAGLFRFGQWWRRATRAGYAAAEHVARHGRAGLPSDRGQVARSLIYGGLLPLVAVFALVAGWPVVSLLILLLYVARWVRLWGRERWWTASKAQAQRAALLRLAHQFAGMQGFLSYWADRLRGRKRAIIEYR
ncbi:glycosyltransferase [Sphingomonas sp. ID0503]|uniref:glycosyltransferase n=1 Tax=Sphingomonas sp. ID0503 TaxID=3399691 RepID=UPI003AFAB951